MELLTDQRFSSVWTQAIRRGLSIGDEDLYRLAERTELLRRLARKVLKTMTSEELSKTAKIVVLKDLERTALGRAVLAECDRRSE